MRYKRSPRKRSNRSRRLVIIIGIFVALLAFGGLAARHTYQQNLRPVNAVSEETQLFAIERGTNLDTIASELAEAGLVRSSWAFKLYVGLNNAYSDLQAGTYSLSPAHSVSDIVALLTHGKISTDTVTILPGQRLEQIREALLNNGFEVTDVDRALDPRTHAGHPALADKPAGVNLEGFLYPETFYRVDTTSAADIVKASLDEMEKRLSAKLRAAFSGHGLSVYEGLILASILEKEAANPKDREQIAQVLLKRLELDVLLQADPTAHYGAYLDGATPSVKHPSPYNTYLHRGLPPTPISNVSDSSLQAAAHPANTDWLYFVAGDDDRTYFSRTLQEHEEATRRYCTELCAER
jgi:UPF0755 protein